MLPRLTFFPVLCLSATLLSCSPSDSDPSPGESDHYTAYAAIEGLNSAETEIGIQSAINPNSLIRILESNRLSERVAQQILAEKLDEELMAPYLGNLPAPTLEELIKNHRRVIELSDSSIIKVGYQHPSADMAAKVANLFVDGLMDYNRALNIGSSPVEDLTYLVEAQSEKLAELEAKLVAYREKHNTMGKTQIQINASARHKLEQLNAQKFQAKNHLDALELKWQLIESYQNENRDLSVLSFIGVTTPDAIKQAIEVIKNDYNAAKADFKATAIELEEVEAEIINQSRVRVEYNALLRDLEVQGKFYQALKQRLEEEQAKERAKARLTDGKIRIIEMANAANAERSD